MAKKSPKPAKNVRSQKGKARKSARVLARRAAGRGRGQESARGLHVASISDPIKLPAGAVYLYAITADKQTRPTKLSIIGINGSGQVIGVPLAGFTAWISSIDAASFAAALEQNMENLDWLAEATLRHQRAVTAIAHSAPR